MSIFYGLFFCLMSLSSVVVLTYNIQMTAADTCMYAISPTIFEQSMYMNEVGEWTYNRSKLVMNHRDLLEKNLKGLFEQMKIEYTFYTVSTLESCDEETIICDGLMIQFEVDYSLFIQERTYRYELHHNR